MFVCQNNQWAISVPVSDADGERDDRREGARPTACRGCASTATTSLACYVAAKAAVDRARRGEGPTFVECLTYRLGGHSSSDDPTKYRDETEAKAWEARIRSLRTDDVARRPRAAGTGRGKRTSWPRPGATITEAIARVEAAAPVPGGEPLRRRVGRGARRSSRTNANDCSASEPV